MSKPLGPYTPVVRAGDFISCCITYSTKLPMTVSISGTHFQHFTPDHTGAF